ncbi:hypothetical protein CTAYLR_005040 [Chrysophaeum taylorii]|uniref:Chitin-binding type-1 domain-containing protein n=1 Tax=Chrysophaeum taylorii TaxID=2483200 RepID=A0AAD7XMH5_9STRA|nr:hypothetical protein CTAYLR_005040 [Chrysophaeum taylorii]
MRVVHFFAATVAALCPEKPCPLGSCCSIWGFCGATEDYCGPASCVADCWRCNGDEVLACSAAHEVVSGETVSAIAERYGATSEDVLAVNSDDIRVGRTLQIPPCECAKATTRPSRRVHSSNVAAADLKAIASFVPDLVNDLVANFTMAATAENEAKLRRSLAYAFASDGDRVRALVENDASFRELNGNVTDDMQQELCELVSSETSRVSEMTIACVCGLTREPFIYCEALLEKEILEFTNDGISERRRRRRRRRLLDENPPSCDDDFPGNNGLARTFEGMAQVVVDNVLADANETRPFKVCVSGDCCVGIPQFPHLKLCPSETCSPGIAARAVNSTTVEACRESACEHYSKGHPSLVKELTTLVVPVDYEVCVVGAEELELVLALLGIDLCLLNFELSYWPFRSYLRGSLDARFLVLYARLDVEYMITHATSDALGICSTHEDDDFCRMNAGAQRFSSELGVEFFLWKHQW